MPGLRPRASRPGSGSGSLPAQQDHPGLRMRIGLHSGRAVVGNMGSDFHFNYTAMGDTVNLAARLEQANKERGTYLMVSEATRQQAGEEFGYRDLGRIPVKGKSEPVQVYELLPARHTELPASNPRDQGPSTPSKGGDKKNRSSN